MAIKVRVEKAKDGHFWASTQNIPGVVTADGSNINELKSNLKEAVELYLETAEDHDTKTFKKFKDGFEFQYDVEFSEIFNIFDVLNKTEFAKRLGINPSLFRQYTGKKDIYISENRAKEIEKGLHELGKELMSIKV